jgi:SAM-dependent methyltransferase
MKTEIMQDGVAISGDRWASRQNRIVRLLRERGIAGIVGELRARGFAGSLAMLSGQLRYALCIVAGNRWDRRYGVETGGNIQLATLNVVGGNKALGAPAVSTSPKTFRHLSRYFPADRKSCTYIDLGAGKGRTLFLAALAGFRKVIGVEFSAELCAAAGRNIETFRDGQDAQIAIKHADATLYRFPETDLVLYFGNPFALELWPAMIANLRESFAANPRAMTIVIAGSEPQTINGAGALLSRCPEFHTLGAGRAPYFLDTYKPYWYQCFAARPS